MKSIPTRYLSTTAKEQTFSESFNIRDVKGLLSGKDMVQELHRHDYFYILVLNKGAGKHAIDFTPYPVRNRSVFFMRPGQVHKLKLKADSSGYLMEFKSDFYYPHDTLSNQLLRQASSKNFCQVDAHGCKNLLAILNSIFQEYTEKRERHQEVIRANLGIFFIELIRNRKNQRGSSNSINSYTHERLEKFLELLEIHISNHKQVSQYADMLNLSTYQLNAITKAALGKTSSQLINEHIILEAKRYLLATSDQVTQIAYHLGYEDVSYFIRFFKKQTGSSPEAFRHNFK